MVEMLLAEKAKAEAERNYYAEQFARADVKLEVINDMLEEAKRKELESATAETVEETTDETAAV